MDEEAWYSVTPEGIARHLAKFIADKCPGQTIIDAFSGVSNSGQLILNFKVGSNAIQFARYFDRGILASEE